MFSFFVLWSCGLWFFGKNQEIEKNILMIISKLGEVLENCKKYPVEEKQVGRMLEKCEKCPVGGKHAGQKNVKSRKIPR